MTNRFFRSNSETGAITFQYIFQEKAVKAYLLPIPMHKQVFLKTIVKLQLQHFYSFQENNKERELHLRLSMVSSCLCPGCSIYLYKSILSSPYYCTDSKSHCPTPFLLLMFLKFGMGLYSNLGRLFSNWSKWFQNVMYQQDKLV